ncbi:MAG: tripartite tricarboxylate transporter TctB family protein [Vicinamibacterales bacterium]
MHRDLAFGGATLIVSGVYYWMAEAIPPSQLADAIGPQGLPKTYAVILAGLSLMLVARALRDPGSGMRDPAGSGSRVPRLFRATGMLLIGIAYILLAPWLGYLLAIAGLILATTYYQGGTVGRQAALVAACGGLFFWLLFVVLMGIAQPPGFFPPQP